MLINQRIGNEVYLTDETRVLSKVAILHRPLRQSVAIYRGEERQGRLERGSLLVYHDWPPKSTAMFSRPGPSCLEGYDITNYNAKAKRHEASRGKDRGREEDKERKTRAAR